MPFSYHTGPIRRWCQIVERHALLVRRVGLADDTIAHDELDAGLEHADVVQWVAVYHDEVRAFTGLNGADLLVQAQQTRGVDRARDQRRVGRHSVVDHELNLERILAVLHAARRPAVAAHGDLYAHPECHLETRPVRLHDRISALAPPRFSDPLD